MKIKTYFASGLSGVLTDSEPVYHMHVFDEMLLVCSGDVIALTPSQYLSHRGPCVIFYKSGHLHAQINSREALYERYYLNFDRGSISRLFPDGNLQDPFSGKDAFLLPLSPGELERLRRAADILCRLCTGTEEEDEIRQQFLLGYFLAEIREIGKNQAFVLPKHVYLTAVSGYISDHIAEKLTIERLAEVFGVGSTKLIRDFREYFSMSVQGYITMERMNRARTLLQQGQSVTDTAYACGFFDSAHFIRVFKKIHRITPAVYRRQCAHVPVLTSNHT